MESRIGESGERDWRDCFARKASEEYDVREVDCFIFGMRRVWNAGLGSNRMSNTSLIVFSSKSCNVAAGGNRSSILVTVICLTSESFLVSVSVAVLVFRLLVHWRYCASLEKSRAKPCILNPPLHEILTFVGNALRRAFVLAFEAVEWK